MAFGRKKVNRRIDRKIFKKTAMRTNSKNIPGRFVPRGGIDL